MKKIIFAILILSIGIILGYGVSLSGFIVAINGDDGVQAESDNREILYWVAPMDPSYRAYRGEVRKPTVQVRG